MKKHLKFIFVSPAKAGALKIPAFAGKAGIIVLLLVFAALTLGACNEKHVPNADPTRHITIISRDGKEHGFNIELALTPQQQEIGLMGRTEMPKDSGMLFVFSQESERSFWMKKTLIPLDMIFIRKDGTIGHVHDSAIPNDLTSVPSNGPALAVLELNGGVAKKFGIEAGDKIRHPFFGAAP